MNEYFEAIKASVELARAGEDARGAADLQAAFYKAMAENDRAAAAVGRHLADRWF
jgi:hypothetical protein